MICISITHKNLTAAKRECFACNDEEQIKLADTVAKTYPEAGLVLLMTCNRSEIYMSGTGTDLYGWNSSLRIQRNSRSRR